MPYVNGDGMMGGWMMACFAVMLLIVVLLTALTALAFTLVRRSPRAPAANG